jgi:Caspase domain/Domain of unknown function (DUF4384)
VKRVIVFLAAALMGAASAFAGDRALLVGVEHYKNRYVPETPGCRADAEKTAELLRTHYQFPPESIKVLLDADATASNIDQQFVHWLIEGTQPGDRVFFLYAGHGSRLPVINDTTEPDGMDETIAPYDVVPETGDNEIRDDRFNELIQQLTGRRAVLLFDSCHSGSISRGIPKLSRFPHGGGARYLPDPSEFKKLIAEQKNSRGFGLPDYAVTSSGSRDLKHNFVDPAAVGHLSGVVVIEAAAATQRSYPFEVDGELRGALTHTFEEVVARGTPTIGSLDRELKSEIRRLHESQKLDGDQVPQVEVISTVSLDQQPLFGNWQVGPEVAFGMNNQSSMKVSLQMHDRKSRYHNGENIEYEVTTDMPGYLYVLVFSQNNVATCIFPNENDRENKIGAGTTSIPRGGYTFPVQEPYGADVNVAIVSKVLLHLGEKVDYSWQEVFDRVHLKAVQDAIAGATRGVGVAAKALAPTDWQAATLVFETVP